MMDIKQIRNDEDLDAAIAEVERLMLLNPKRGSPDGDRLEAMADLVAAYEAKHYPIDPDDPVDMTLTPYKGQHAHVRFELNDGIFAGRRKHPAGDAGIFRRRWYCGPAGGLSNARAGVHGGVDWGCH